jgi:hypothetical protein
MRPILGSILFAAASPAVLAGAAHAQTPVSASEAATCYGFSFGEWTPPLDWRAAGHERTLESISIPLASGGRGWAAELTQPDANGTMLLFPSWWPVGVKVALPTRTFVPGDTLEGHAIALVGNGFATPPRATVRAWLVRCAAPRGDSTASARAGAAVAPTSNDHLPTGTWRGTSTCLTRHGQCGSDSVVYRIAFIADAPDSVLLAPSTIRARGERHNDELRCRYDAPSAILACDAPEGVLRLAVRGNEIGGRLTRRDGVDLRYVYVRRAAASR